MATSQIEIQIIAALVAIACAIPGVFLVLRRMALISDAISHSILLGIVVGFFISGNLNSPLLIFLAAVVGVLTVVLVETIQKTKLVKEDTAIGLVFPAFFSLGIILIALNANDIHLDIDAVLLGELAFAPFDRLIINEADWGPKSLWRISILLFFTILLLLLFYKELKISTFDAGLSAALGFSPLVIHYGLMTVSSVTIVGAFDAVGAILVVALIIVPASISYLLTEKLNQMLTLSVFIGLFSAISGYWLSHFLDASIAGSMATVLGFIFLVVYLFSPKKGVFAHQFKRKQQQKEVMLLTFLLHLNSLNKENDLEERSIKHLHQHFKWANKAVKEILKLAENNQLIVFRNQKIYLTEKGQNLGNIALEYIVSDKTEDIKKIKENFLFFR